MTSFLLGLLAAAGALHASLTHEQMCRLRVQSWSPVYFCLDDEGRLRSTQASVFLSCGADDVVHFAYHVAGNVFCCAWRAPLGVRERARLLAHLRAWHWRTHRLRLRATLSDPIDARAWSVADSWLRLEDD